MAEPPNNRPRRADKADATNDASKRQGSVWPSSWRLSRASSEASDKDKTQASSSSKTIQQTSLTKSTSSPFPASNPVSTGRVSPMSAEEVELSLYHHKAQYLQLSNELEKSEAEVAKWKAIAQENDKVAHEKQTQLDKLHNTNLVLKNRLEEFQEQTASDKRRISELVQAVTKLRDQQIIKSHATDKDEESTIELGNIVKDALIEQLQGESDRLNHETFEKDKHIATLEAARKDDVKKLREKLEKERTHVADLNSQLAKLVLKKEDIQEQLATQQIAVAAIRPAGNLPGTQTQADLFNKAVTYAQDSNDTVALYYLTAINNLANAQEKEVNRLRAINAQLEHEKSQNRKPDDPFVLEVIGDNEDLRQQLQETNEGVRMRDVEIQVLNRLIDQHRQREVKFGIAGKGKPPMRATQLTAATDSTIESWGNLGPLSISTFPMPPTSKNLRTDKQQGGGLDSPKDKALPPLPMGMSEKAKGKMKAPDYIAATLDLLEGENPTRYPAEWPLQDKTKPISHDSDTLNALEGRIPHVVAPKPGLRKDMVRREREAEEAQRKAAMEKEQDAKNMEEKKKQAMSYFFD